MICCYFYRHLSWAEELHCVFASLSSSGFPLKQNITWNIFYIILCLHISGFQTCGFLFFNRLLDTLLSSSLKAAAVLLSVTKH